MQACGWSEKHGYCLASDCKRSARCALGVTVMLPGRAPQCGHAYYTVDRVTGEHTCNDCGKMLIDSIGRVLDR